MCVCVCVCVCVRARARLYLCVCVCIFLCVRRLVGVGEAGGVGDAHGDHVLRAVGRARHAHVPGQNHKCSNKWSDKGGQMGLCARAVDRARHAHVPGRSHTCQTKVVKKYGQT